MTDHLTIATSEADARAAEAVEQHHAQMSGALVLKAESLAAAVRAARPADVEQVRLDLVRWCREDLVPHALAEESTMYLAAGKMPRARLLVEAMLVEHQRIIGLVDGLGTTSEPVAAAAIARALRELFEAHLAKENDQILPLLVASPDVSIAELLGGMHEMLGGGGLARRPGRGGQRWLRHRGARLWLRRVRRVGVPRARRECDPARHPARHDLRRARRRAARQGSRAHRAARPAAAAGAARAAGAGDVRDRLPRARPRDVAACPRAPRAPRGLRYPDWSPVARRGRSYLTSRWRVSTVDI